MSPPVPSKLLTDDVSLLMVLIDTNPYFWSSIKSSFNFGKFLSHVLAFLNSILLLNQLNQVVVITTGFNSCSYVFDSSVSPTLRAESLLPKLEAFVENDESLSHDNDTVDGVGSSLLSGALSMALCYIQRVFRSGPLHPQPRICCNHEFYFLSSTVNGTNRFMCYRIPAFCFPTAGFLYNWRCISEASAVGRTFSISLGRSCSLLANRWVTIHLQKFWEIAWCPRFCSIMKMKSILDELSLFVLSSFLWNRQYLLRICIRVTFYNYPNLLVLIFVPRASATKTQLTWVLYALFAYQYSASITRNVLHADLFLVRRKHKIPHCQIGKERLHQIIDTKFST